MAEQMTPQERDKRMMQSQWYWHRYPWLPIKRGANRTLEVGVLYANNKPTVYLIDLFEITKQTDWKVVPKKVYDSWEELQADGWRVD